MCESMCESVSASEGQAAHSPLAGGAFAAGPGAGEKKRVEEEGQKKRVEEENFMKESQESAGPGAGEKKRVEEENFMKESQEREMLRHLQRKLLGFVLQPVYEAQDFIRVACGPDQKGRVSGEKKRWLANLMAECAPLARLYGAVCHLRCI